MTLINRKCELIYRTTSGNEDELGNDVPTESRVVSVCEVQQQSASEAPSGSPASSSWVGFFLPGVQLEAVDAVNVPGAGGGMFEVVGDADERRSPLSRRGVYTGANLNRVGDGEEIEEGS